MATIADFKKAYTNTYWVTFTNRKPGCIDCAPDDDPIAVASALGEIQTIDSLPYPADPVLHRDPNDKTPCPSFCYAPAQCKGRTCCPQSYACSE
jgi:hypothetical protein